MLCKLPTATLVGVDAQPVEVQVEVSGGLPGFFLVGLPMSAVREGSVRVRAALRASGFDLGSVRTTVNLAPADLPKHGSAFDLPIALATIASKGLLAPARRDLLYAGELALDGGLHAIRGALSLAQAARAQGLAGVALPRQNAAEAALVAGIEVHGVSTLREAAQLAAGEATPPAVAPRPLASAGDAQVDFAEICGQPEARRAAEVAAAGGHNLMLVGPPGAGKTMLARRIATILPALSREEALETTQIHSVAGLLDGSPIVQQRPFRAPHHTCSATGLVGGGSFPRPGEVSLAHNGVLFLDELPEFPRAALEALRQPIEDGAVSIVRTRQAVSFPARFMLVAAMNPCPCGYRGSDVRTCTCGELSAERYRARLSGPLLDRFDIFVYTPPVPTAALLTGEGGESSAQIGERVARARQRQRQRFARSRSHCNAQMNGRQLRRHVPLGAALRELLVQYCEVHRLSARAIHRACRVARTLADLEDRDDVADEHVLLALTMQEARWAS